MGMWDYELSFTGQIRRSADAGAVARDSNEAPTIFTAIQQQKPD